MNSDDVAFLKQQTEANTYVVHGNVKDADCVIGFSFGYVDAAGEVKPGKSNEQLAAYIERQFPKVPLIAQFEINKALTTFKPALVISESRKKGEYLDSREIAEQALIFMQARGWPKAIIVTHPAMEARNDALCRKLGIITITTPGLEAIEYDENSAQPWTRDKDAWWQREAGIIDLCVQKGWL